MYFLHSRLVVDTLIVIGFLFTVDAKAAEPGRYKPITKEEIPRLELAYYYTPDKDYRKPDFAWKFREGKFALAAEESQVPEELMQRLLGKNVTPGKVRGRWELIDDNGMKLVLFSIVADGHKIKRKVILPIYRTAPTVIRIGNPQLVFTVRPPEEKK